MEIYAYNTIKIYGLLTGLIYTKVVISFDDLIITFPIWIIGFRRKVALEVREKLEMLEKEEGYDQ